MSEFRKDVKGLNDGSGRLFTDAMNRMAAAEAEANTLRAQLAEARAELADDNDTIGANLVTWVSNCCGPDAEGWHDEFLAWYQPDQWLGGHRAASAFLSGKFERLTRDYAEACVAIRQLEANVAEAQAQLTAARARAERAEGALVEAHDDAAGSWECLMMASEILAAFLGPDHMKGVPPMFYPEAIRSLVYKSARAGILAVFREQATVPTEAEIKRLLQQARALILHQQSDADRAASIPQGAAT